ncbi:MAG: hypothetical protein RL723_990 [Actinomycetota bacterium]
MSNTGAPKLKTHFGNLCGLTRAGSTGDYNYLVIANGIKNFLSALRNRKISRIGDVHLVLRPTTRWANNKQGCEDGNNNNQQCEC